MVGSYYLSPTMAINEREKRLTTNKLEIKSFRVSIQTDKRYFRTSLLCMVFVCSIQIQLSESKTDKPTYFPNSLLGSYSTISGCTQL